MERKRILLVSVNWIGDCIMAMPSVQAYRVQNPDVEMHVLCRPSLQALWAMQPAVDRVHPVLPNLRSMYSVSRALRGMSLDEVFVLPNSFRSALSAWMLGAPRRTGRAGQGRSLLLTNRLHFPEDVEGGHQMLETLYLLGLDVDSTSRESPRLRVPESAREWVRPRLKESLSWIGLIPGAARGPSKEWPLEHYLKLGQRIVGETDFGVVLFGGAGDRERCASICRELGVKAVNLAGETDLPQWAAALERCSSVVANDSGGMHLAAALGIGVVAIYGITDPGKTGPLGPRCRVIKASGAASREISRHSQEAQARLAAIQPETVWEVLKEQLSERKGGFYA